MTNNPRVPLMINASSFITAAGSTVEEVMRQLTDRENRISNDASVKRDNARARGGISM